MAKAGEITFLVAILMLCTALGCEYIKYGADHTMCKYTGPNCKIEKRGFSAAEKDIAIKTHNELRQKVANGQQAGQPGASNMKQVKWDEELATIAQRWADQCKFGHDTNRASMKYPSAGQNVYVGWTSGSDDSVPIKEAVTLWYDEVKEPGFNKNNIKPFKFDFGAGHYTQVVWAETEAVGCGFSNYKENGKNTRLIVCNYGPTGNMMGGTMYEVGKACSNCKNGCSSAYPGLCN